MRGVRTSGVGCVGIEANAAVVRGDSARAKEALQCYAMDSSVSVPVVQRLTLGVEAVAADKNNRGGI